MWESCEALGEMAGRQAAVHQLFMNSGCQRYVRARPRTEKCSPEPMSHLYRGVTESYHGL